MPVGAQALERLSEARSETRPLTTLQKRSDFLLAARGRKRAMPGFVVQARRRGRHESALAAVRVGFTCSKKVGTAVARNRAKRRLRALARRVLSASGRPGWDYVLIGRPKATVTRPFALMCDELNLALRGLHRADT